MAIVCAGVAAWQGRRAPGAVSGSSAAPAPASADQLNAGLDVAVRQASVPNTIAASLPRQANKRRPGDRRCSTKTVHSHIAGNPARDRAVGGRDHHRAAGGNPMCNEHWRTEAATACRAALQPAGPDNSASQPKRCALICAHKWSWRMRTTLELPDPLFARLRARAASERVTLKQLLRS